MSSRALCAGVVCLRRAHLCSVVWRRAPGATRQGCKAAGQGEDMDPRAIRRGFLPSLFVGLQVIWPMLSAVIVLVAGRCEGWPVQQAIYCSLVTGQTSG